MKFSAFPDIEGDQPEARLMLPPAVTLAATESAVARVTAALDAVATPDGATLVRRVVCDSTRTPTRIRPAGIWPRSGSIWRRRANATPRTRR